MAETSESHNILADMFKHFPIATTIGCVVVVYLVWRATGGIERGVERHAEGKDSIFIELRGLSPAHGHKEYFGVIEQEKINKIDAE